MLALLAQPIVYSIYSTHFICICFGRCVFVDAGVTAVDLERKKKKEEMKAKESQDKSVAEHGELALITVEQPTQPKIQERVPLRPPMLQVWIDSFNAKNKEVQLQHELPLCTCRWFDWLLSNMPPPYLLL